MSADSAQAWVHWWCDAWGHAHDSWRSRFAEHTGLALVECERLARQRPEVFMRFAGMDTPQPPEPHPDLLHWLGLPPEQRHLALALVEQICSPSRPSRGYTDEHKPWCRSLAKALRPGLWLDGQEPEAEVLLGGWLGVRYWHRLRLELPVPAQAWVPGPHSALTAAAPGKLKTLWPAVLWRVAANQPEHAEVSDAG